MRWWFVEVILKINANGVKRLQYLGMGVLIWDSSDVSKPLEKQRHLLPLPLIALIALVLRPFFSSLSHFWMPIKMKHFAGGYLCLVPKPGGLQMYPKLAQKILMWYSQSEPDTKRSSQISYTNKTDTKTRRNIIHTPILLTRYIDTQKGVPYIEISPKMEDPFIYFPINSNIYNAKYTRYISKFSLLLY